MPTVDKTKALVAADYFILKFKSEAEKGLTNKKLQKLLYYSQAWSLVFYDKAVFEDEIQAWVHGPAVPAVYEAFKEFGSKQIEGIAIDPSEFTKLTVNDKEILDMVWQVYGGFDGDYLEQLTHSEAPWIHARAGLEPFESSIAPITNESMKKYYGLRLQEAK